ncbi:hypothetical protein BJ742DRAFT_454177 [Cladochytrium replicatum]|nr:hypothetical protein BJ742DRAFT_454177 [Cladochytrium replicatum]
MSWSSPPPWSNGDEASYLKPRQKTTRVSGETQHSVPAVDPTLIHAPISTVWTLIHSFDRYSEWNPFIRHAWVDGNPTPGKRITCVLPGPIWPLWIFSPETFTRIEPPRELAFPSSHLPPLPEGMSYVQDENGTVHGRAAWMEFIFDSIIAKLNLVRSFRVQRMLEAPVALANGGKRAVTVYETWDDLYGPAAHLAFFGWCQSGLEAQTAKLKARAEEIESKVDEKDIQQQTV